MKDKHTREFLLGFARQAQAANLMVKEPDSDSDSDLPLMQQRVLTNLAKNIVAVDPSENMDSALDLALNEIQISPSKKQVWRRDEAIIE
jgi:hypothetical protein